MNTAKLKKFFDLGLTVVPIKTASKKIPEFKKWQSTKTLEDIPSSSLKDFEAIGLLAEPSGVLIIDIDTKNDPSEQIAGQFLKALEMSLDCFDDLLIQMTPSGGYHVIFKVDPVPPTMKLAKYDTGVVIETRGQGGQALIHPSPGYEMIQGSFKKLAYLDEETTALVLSIARSFDKSPKKSDAKTRKIQKTVGDTPFKKFNAEADILEMLVGAGWEYVESNDLGHLVKRPGRTTAKHSGIIFTDKNRFFCHTTSTDFDTEHSYSAFDVAVMTGQDPTILTTQILDKYGDLNQIPINQERPKNVKEFPFDILPSIVKDYIFVHEYHNVTIPDFSAMTFMTLVGAMIGTNVSIESRTGWVSHATLWVALSADKGKNKTESMGIIVDPINSYTNKQAVRYYAAKHEAEEAGVKFQEKNPQFIVSDITFEALGMLMAQVENGVMMIQQELDSWVTSMTEYSDASKSNKWIGFHDNKSTSVNRVTRKDIIIENPSCPVIGPIQPAILAKLMNDSDMVHSGFVDRLLVVNPDHKFRELPQQEMPQDIIDVYGEYIVDLFHRIKAMDPKRYKMDQAAKARFMDRVNYLRRLQDKEEIMSMRGFYDKVSKYFSRFILIIHCYQDVIHDQIQVQTVDQAFQLVQYFINMNRKTYNQNSIAKEIQNIHKQSLKKFPDQAQKRYLYMQGAGLSYQQISALENKSIDTIKKGIYRAKKR